MSFFVLRSLASAGVASAAPVAAPPMTALRRKSARVPPVQLVQRLRDGPIVVDRFEGELGFHLRLGYVVNPVASIAALVLSCVAGTSAGRGAGLRPARSRTQPT
jgi:hypothetical protein